MATRRQAAGKRPAPRLYLVTDQIDDAGTWRRALEAALAGVEVAAVLLRLADGDESSMVDRVKMLACAVQERGAALLLERPQIVACSGADGAHLQSVDGLKQALPSLKPACIAGVGGLRTRHDAMLAAEAGADYVMFGEPAAGGNRPSSEAVVERVAWWSELFEVPCVGFAANLHEAAALAQAGADFVALGAFVWADPRGPAVAMAAAAQSVSSAELV